MDKTLKILLTIFVMVLLVGISAVSFAAIRDNFFTNQTENVKIVYVDRNITKYINVTTTTTIQDTNKTEIDNKTKVQVKLIDQNAVMTIVN